MGSSHSFYSSSFPPLTYWWLCFPLSFQCICSLLHINKIFEVGISEHLANKLQHMNIDLIGKVSISKCGSISSTNSILKFGQASCCYCNSLIFAPFMSAGKFFHYSWAGLCFRPGQFKILSGFIFVWKLLVCLIKKHA